MSEHIETRQKLKDQRITDFNQLINDCMLDPDDRIMLQMYYLENKDFGFIADTLGFAKSTVIARHKKALKKLNKML